MQRLPVSFFRLQNTLSLLLRCYHGIWFEKAIVYINCTVLFDSKKYILVNWYKFLL